MSPSARATRSTACWTPSSRAGMAKVGALLPYGMMAVAPDDKLDAPMDTVMPGVARESTGPRHWPFTGNVSPGNGTRWINAGG